MSTPGGDRWQLVNMHLDRALELSDEERTAWLASLREESPALADDLQALLDEHRVAAAEGFLDGGAASLPDLSAIPPLPGAGIAGETLGAYTLVSPIGQGGMGSVWLAIRSDGRFERRAAVKFLNIALVGRGEERFKREGSLLARLAHPHIAQLVDAGVSTSGQPYLILEHVDGEPIDRYCDRHALGVDDRIRLFLDVLSAVAHAHANLIVHRDIKPSNVFVNESGQAKLLDFGIAKLLEDRTGGASAPLTREGGFAMTPEYAAPEQMTGAPVTTATDVYALGVLLYVILTGRHPAADAVGSPAEIVKAVVHTQARPMSAVVTQPKLRRVLKGDLDTIVARTLKKNAPERYTSVTALADDLRRYLRHEPISARPDTVAYRLAKFVRRNRLPVAAAVLTIVGLSIGVVVANRERAAAERRFRQLRQLSTKVFDLDYSIRTLPGSTAARQSLVTVSLEYLEGLASDAGTDIDLAQELSDGYWRAARIQGVPVELNLGDFSKAEASLEKADALAESILRSRPNSRAAMLRSAVVAQDRMILAQSEHRRADALAQARKAAERIDRWLTLAPTSPDERDQAAGVIGNIGLAYLNLHLYKDAIGHTQHMLEIVRPLPNARYRVGVGLSVLSSALRYQGDVDGALAAIREARTISEANALSDPTNRMMDLFGVLFREGLTLGEEGSINAGRPAEAVDALQRALDITEEAAQRDANDTASRSREATAARDLGNILRSRDPQRALAVYDLGLRRMAEIRNNVKARRDEGALLANSSYALRALGRRAEAKQRVDRAIALLRDTKDYPTDRIDIDSSLVTVLSAVADQLAAEGHFPEAIAGYEQLLSKMSASVSEANDDLRNTAKLSVLYGALADLYDRAGNDAKAAATAERRRALWRGWDARLPGNPFVRRQMEDDGVNQPPFPGLSSFPRRFRSPL
jgi:serine/threonine protein kinase/tetratricopeptide (TPR) repeat protein